MINKQFSMFKAQGREGNVEQRDKEFRTDEQGISNVDGLRRRGFLIAGIY